MLTVTKETAIQLKESGYPQNESYFMYVEDTVVARETLAYMGSYKSKEEAIAAPTMQEILDKLPQQQTNTESIAKMWIDRHNI